MAKLFAADILLRPPLRLTGSDTPMRGDIKKLMFISCRLVVSRKPMKTNAPWNVLFAPIIAALLAGATVPAAIAGTPQYQIYDIGVIDAGDDASQGFGVSHGGMAVGRSIRTGGSQAFTWTLQGGIVGLPNLAGRNHAVANSAAENLAVGTAATTLFGSDRLPIKWFNGVVSQLPLPPGEALGDANSVNFSGIAVGSVDAGSNQRGAVYLGGGGEIIP